MNYNYQTKCLKFALRRGIELNIVFKMFNIIGAVAIILMLGGFLHQPSANALEDATVKKIDDNSIVGRKNDSKKIRSVTPGAYF